MKGFVSLLYLLSTVLPALASTPSCTCTTALLPVHIDIEIPKDPTSPLAGLNLTKSEKRRLVADYNINSVLCQPAVDQHPSLVQLLIHGFTYNYQYWTVPVSTFSNYSYTDFACENGLTTFAYDAVDAGHSSRPLNASDVQLPARAAISSQIGYALKNPKSSLYSIFRPSHPFKNVVGIGHSLGSITLNYGAIIDGSNTPFDELILTGWIHNTFIPTIFNPAPAREVDPLRWGNLDPAYVTTVSIKDRALFWPSHLTHFSAQLLTFDDLTKDIGSVYFTFQIPADSIAAKGFNKPVTQIVGSEDQVFCPNTACQDLQGLTAAEKHFFPDSKNFSVVIVEGSGHDLNFDFNARSTWKEMVALVVNLKA